MLLSRCGKKLSPKDEGPRFIGKQDQLWLRDRQQNTAVHNVLGHNLWMSFLLPQHTGGKQLLAPKGDQVVHNRIILKYSFPLKYGGNYIYRQFNIQQFYVLPTQCIYVFCVDLRTNSDYFPIHH